MRFSRQEHWSGLPFPPPGHLPTHGRRPLSNVACLVRQFLTTGATCRWLLRPRHRARAPAHHFWALRPTYPSGWPSDVPTSQTGQLRLRALRGAPATKRLSRSQDCAPRLGSFLTAAPHRGPPGAQGSWLPWGPHPSGLELPVKSGVRATPLSGAGSDGWGMATSPGLCGLFQYPDQPVPPEDEVPSLGSRTNGSGNSSAQRSLLWHLDAA